MGSLPKIAYLYLGLEAQRRMASAELKPQFAARIDALRRLAKAQGVELPDYDDYKHCRGVHSWTPPEPTPTPEQPKPFALPISAHQPLAMGDLPLFAPPKRRRTKKNV